MSRTELQLKKENKELVDKLNEALKALDSSQENIDKAFNKWIEDLSRMINNVLSIQDGRFVTHPD